MKKISTVIITKNEKNNIRDCLESVKWADEIVVVDSGSTDGTVDICKDFGCKVIESEWLGFGKTKQLAVDSATHEWIFSIDADERASVELQIAIKEILSKKISVEAYRMKRNSYYLGKLIRFSGWQKDCPLRLFEKESGRFNDNIVHESVQVDGQIGYISAPLVHYSYPNLETHLDKINRYTMLGAQNLFEQNRKSSITGAMLKGIFKFLKMYLIKLGFLDGLHGLILAIISSFGVSLKYFKLWQLNR